MSDLSPDTPRLDHERVLADLRELDRLTGGPDGARRLCWGDDWRVARDFLAGRLDAIGIEPDRDEAGNTWAFLPGGEGPALVLGSHLDSVPHGGWLDGALGVIAGLGVMRAWAEAGTPPPRPLGLVDWADEEGARFGRSLFGSSAVAGRLDPSALAAAVDADGRGATAVLAEAGVVLEQAPLARSRIAAVGAYLELHIEQGPVLDEAGLAVAAVSGCVGIERFRLTFGGRASHAGTTPMDARSDAALAAAETALGVERIANEFGGTGTTGQLSLAPGVPTVIAASAELVVDLRQAGSANLEAMLRATRELAAAVAGARGCRLTETPIWRIDPVSFDPDLVAVATAVATGKAMTSGALHDAAEMAIAGVPTAMLFCRSIGGISHSPEENTKDEDLLESVRLFGELVDKVMRHDASDR